MKYRNYFSSYFLIGVPSFGWIFLSGRGITIVPCLGFNITEHVTILLLWNFQAYHGRDHFIVVILPFIPTSLVANGK